MLDGWGCQARKYENGRTPLEEGGGEGGCPPFCPLPPPDQSDHNGNNEMYDQENLVGPFLIHNFLGPRPPPLLSSSISPRCPSLGCRAVLPAIATSRGGDISSVLVRDPPPSPPPTLRAHLVAKGQ